MLAIPCVVNICIFLFFFFFFHGDEFLLSFAGRVLNLVKIGFESSERFEDIKIIFRTNVFNIRFSENWDLFIFFFCSLCSVSIVSVNVSFRDSFMCELVVLFDMGRDNISLK